MSVRKDDAPKWSPQEILSHTVATHDGRIEFERAYCQLRLRNFVRRAWQIVERKREFSRTAQWYVDAICEHLEALIYSHIQKLLINMPGRLGKSLLSSVFLPAWVWTFDPSFRGIFASYAAHLSRRDSRKCRLILRSEWYRALWGHKFAILQDADTVERFDNDQAGFRIATSVGGLGTGEGGRLVSCDDPHNVLRAESQVERNEAIRWWDETMGDRLDDPKTGGFLITAHRTHAQDLSQHVIDRGDYVHLMLPMEYEPARACWTKVKPRAAEPSKDGRYKWDPRTKEGELMDENRFDAKAVASIKTNLGSYAWPARLQQRPSMREGAMVKLDWFGRFGVPLDKYEQIVQSWDTANKKGVQNAYSVCGTFGKVNAGLWHLLHVYRERHNSPELNKIARSLALTRWGTPNAILIEDQASGTALIQHLRAETNLPIIDIRPQQDKVTRMDGETPALESGRIALPEIAEWLPQFETEMRDFPGSAYMDQADMLSQFLGYIRQRNPGEDDWNLY